MKHSNCYEDPVRVDAYAMLGYPGTYYLAFRDLPEIILEQYTGIKALDFGCGSGRSARFLKRLGFETTGVDISEQMIEKARLFDPEGDYRHVENNLTEICGIHSYDLVLSAFTFDNIPTMESKIMIFKTLGEALKSGGRIVNLVSSPEIYVNEWASFTTKEFTENKDAKCGDSVRIVIKDIDDRRPVNDILWTDDAYKEIFKRAGLELIATHRPLAREDEPFIWINETTIAPWTIYILKKAQEFASEEL